MTIEILDDLLKAFLIERDSDCVITLKEDQWIVELTWQRYEYESDDYRDLAEGSGSTLAEAMQFAFGELSRLGR